MTTPLLHKLFTLFTVGFLLLMVAPARAQQNVGGCQYADADGDVLACAEFLAAYSDGNQIDGYADAENLDYTQEDVEYVGSQAMLLDNSTLVYGTPLITDSYIAQNDLYAPTHVGDMYTIQNAVSACYYDYSDPDDPDGGDCDGDPTMLGVLSIQINTAVPQIGSISPSSGIQNSTKSFTVNGSNLVDNFGYSQVNFYGSGITGSVQNPNPNQPSQITVQYTTTANATIGQSNVTISTSFGESEPVKFTVGYPPAVIKSVTPNPWIAGTSFNATITGTGFGTAPTVSIAAAGVSAGAAQVQNGGATIVVPIVVAANAPNEPVAIVVTPGYVGNTYTCGSCNGSSPNGTSTVEVEAVTPAPTIMRVMNQADLANCTNGAALPPGAGGTSVFAGEQVMLCVAVPAGFSIQTSSWTFNSEADITGGFTNTAENGRPSRDAGGQEMRDPVLTNSNVTFFFRNPGTAETAHYHWALNNGDGVGASGTAGFAIHGPNGNLLPSALMLLQGAGVQIDTTGGAALQLTGLHYNSPNHPGSVGISFAAQAQTPAGANSAFMWVQLLNDNEGTYLKPAGLVPSFSPPFAGLDGTYPYFSDTATTTFDAPYSGLPSIYGEASRHFDATMYLMWDPALPTGCQPATTSSDGSFTQTASNCTSTPVPLGSVQWKWEGCAINTLAPQANGTGYVRFCGANTLLAPQSAAGYPEWTVTVMPLGVLD